jgi:hypothetical protein
MNLDDVRREFPALERQVFLAPACVWLAPQRAVARIRDFREMAATCLSASWTRYTSGVDGARVSCHLFNNQADIDRLTEHVGTFLRRHAEANA